MKQISDLSDFFGILTDNYIAVWRIPFLLLISRSTRLFVKFLGTVWRAPVCIAFTYHNIFSETVIEFFAFFYFQSMIIKVTICQYAICEYGYILVFCAILIGSHFQISDSYSCIHLYQISPFASFVINSLLSINAQPIFAIHERVIDFGFDIIIIIISCWQHGYPWPSLATPPYRSSP